RGAWWDVDESQLWLYHLHYHDALADLAWAARADERALRALVAALESWLDRWESGGSPAWHAYPTSVRCVNWLRMLAWTGQRLPAPLRERVTSTQARQLAALASRLEYHLGGNHLLRNAWALTVAARAHAGRVAERIEAAGRRLFSEQIVRQVLSDGMHEERSPMYHARALRDALEVLAVLRASNVAVPVDVVVRVRAMADALPWLRPPNGTLQLLNDSANDHGLDL